MALAFCHSLSTSRPQLCLQAFGPRIRHVCPFNTLSRLPIRDVLHPSKAGQQDLRLTAAGDGRQNTNQASAEVPKDGKSKLVGPLWNIQMFFLYLIPAIGYMYLLNDPGAPWEAHVAYLKHLLRLAAKWLGLPV